VCIGNYTKDTIISPAGVKYVDGGAVNYAAHATARLGVKTAVVTRLAQEDARVVRRFEEAGIACFPVYTPHSTLMRLEYPTTDPDIRRLSVATTAGAITVEQVEGLQAKAAVIGASLRGEAGLDVIQQLKKKGVVIAAELRYEPWEEMQMTLAQVDIVKSDAVEAEFLTGETDLRKAARFYAVMGPKEIVLTHKDGVLVYAGAEFYDVGFYPARLDGRSGRGDTCIGVYTAMRLSKTPPQACVWAAAVTSLKMEDLGPFKRSIADVEALIHARYNHGSLR
jgi:sugar/nucleoside kinase (ribokinase family)